MYVGVDVGGTKTLVAALTDDGEILESRKFPTPENYKHFLLELQHALVHMEHKDFKAGAAGIPVTNFNRDTGRAINFGNLPWHNVLVQADLERVFGCPFAVNNDAKLASLSEAMLLKGEYRRLLYVTISTGIGYALTVNGEIDDNIGDGGGRSIMLEHKGKLQAWETYASGKAIVARYGERAEDIHDEPTWKAIARDLTQGFLELIAIMQPDVIVVGGSVGNYFERFQLFLESALKQYETPLLPIPDLRKAQRPNEAVIFGCYDLAIATFSQKNMVEKAGKKHAKAA
ncbi:MAG: ROK family protein [Candidatus Saccharimonadales bacterium]